jgi:hypothetical protein
MSRKAPSTTGDFGPQPVVPAVLMDGSGNMLTIKDLGNGVSALAVQMLSGEEAQATADATLAALKAVLDLQQQILAALKAGNDIAQQQLAATQQSNVLLAGSLRVKII